MTKVTDNLISFLRFGLGVFVIATTFLYPSSSLIYDDLLVETFRNSINEPAFGQLNVGANDQDVQTYEDQSVEIQITANEIDEDTVFWIKNGPNHGSLQGIDENQIVTSVDNIVTYTPDKGYIGQDSLLVMPTLDEGSVGTGDTTFETGTISIDVNPLTGLQEEIVANAGVDQTVTSGDSVMLDGTGSEGLNLSFEWERINNEPQISDWTDDITEVKPTFTAPSVDEPTDIEFDLLVTQDGPNGGSGDDQVIITVNPNPNFDPGQLALKIQVEENPINVGKEQTIRVTAYDKISNRNIENAIIDGSVTYSNGYTKNFHDGDGKAIYHWKIASKTEPGEFTVVADGSAPRYQPTQESVTFNVINEDDPTPGPTPGPTHTPPLGYLGWVMPFALLGVIGGIILRHFKNKNKMPYSQVEVMTQGGLDYNL